MTLTSIGIAQYQAGAIDIIDTGSGDTVTFDGSGANVYSDNFEVTLSDPGAGGITFNGNSSFGTFSLSATTTDDIVLTSGASLKTSSGNITLSANQQATPTAGNFAGVTVNDATIQATGSGTVTVMGTGGNDSGGDQYGVLVEAGGEISGGTTTGVGVMGTGGAVGSLGDNYGVYVTGSDSQVTSGGGNVSVTGQGQGTPAPSTPISASLPGHRRHSGPAVPARSRYGHRRHRWQRSRRLLPARAPRSPRAAAPSRSPAWARARPAGDDDGVDVVPGATITAGGTATVTVMGTAAAYDRGQVEGVVVFGTGTAGNLQRGNVQVTGQGRHWRRRLQRWCRTRAAGKITAGDAAGHHRSLSTASGAGVREDVGVQVTGTDATLTSSGGNVQVTGLGGGSGASGSNPAASRSTAGANHGRRRRHGHRQRYRRRRGTDPPGVLWSAATRP